MEPPTFFSDQRTFHHGVSYSNEITQLKKLPRRIGMPVKRLRFLIEQL
jgi:hypothetical protein